VGDETRVGLEELEAGWAANGLNRVLDADMPAVIAGRVKR
jgi:hypothetical protein